MSIRRIIGILMATAITASAISAATIASPTFGHDEDGEQSSAPDRTPHDSASPVTVLPADMTLGTLEAPREVDIAMTDDLRYDPEMVVVSEGETIRFLLHNPTASAHDFLIGDLDAQNEHHEQMAMGMGHMDEEAEIQGGLPHAVTLQPGESTEVVATFDEAGELLIGCHVPGHWEAGMRAAVTVLPAMG